MADSGEFLEIAAIWENTSKNGKVYYSGSLGKCKILMFEVNSDNPKAPKFKICLAARSEEDEAYKKKNQQQAESEQPREREQPRDSDNGPMSGPDSGDIPF